MAAAGAESGGKGDGKAAGDAALPSDDAMFRFELRTSKKSGPSAFDHDGAEAAHDGIELGEYSRKSGVVLTRGQMRSSPYYSRQLDGPWAEKRGLRLTLPSSQHMEAMQAVLTSIEDGDSVEITDETQLQVLALAHKLELTDLLHRCERYVALALGEDTVVGALALAQRYELRGLTRCCYYWIKRSSDPQFAGSVADAVAREAVRAVDDLSGGAATASAAALSGDGRWRTRMRDTGADTGSSSEAMGPAFDVDGISGKMRGRAGHESGVAALVELARQEREAKRAFFLPVEVVDMPKPRDKAKAGLEAAGGGGGSVAAATSGAAAGAPADEAGAFLGDDGEESAAGEADGRVRMFASDPLGASRAPVPAAGGGAGSAEAPGPAESDDEDAGEEDAGLPKMDGTGNEDAEGGAGGGAGGGDAAEAGEAAATADEEAEPSAVDLALAADATAELGYACPEPLDEGTIQAEDVARYRQLKQRRAAGRLPRFYRVKRPRLAGYPGMMRCYIRRVRDGYGACKASQPQAEWKRVVREVMGEDAASERAEAAERVRRPQGADGVVAAAKAREGVPMCGKRRRHYYELRRERDHSLIMAAVCVDEAGSFVFTRRGDDARPHGRHFVGSVRGDRLGTRFLINDFGMAADAGVGPARRLAEVVPAMAQRTVAEVHFATNIMGTVPNSCSVVLHPTPANSAAEDLLPKSLNKARQRSVANQAALANAGILASATRFVSSVFEGGAAMLFSMDGEASPVRMPDDPHSTSRSVCVGVGRASDDAADAHSDSMASHVAGATGQRPAFAPPRVARLGSRQPDWNEDMEAWTMDFRSRATLASKKNFQLVPASQRGDQEPSVLFLMGKRGKDLYSLDFAPPLSPAAAFGIALTTFAQKWAVA